MISKREISHIETAFRLANPPASNYNEKTMREAVAAIKQWRVCARGVAAMLEVAQEDSLKKSFDKRKFLTNIGINPDEPIETTS